LILECVIREGNLADTDRVEKMLDRRKPIYGRYPSQQRFRPFVSLGIKPGQGPPKNSRQGNLFSS